MNLWHQSFIQQRSFNFFQSWSVFAQWAQCNALVESEIKSLPFEGGKKNYVQLFMKTPRLVGSCLLQTAGALFAGRPPPAVHYDQHNHLDTSSASCTHKEIHAGTLGKRRNMRYIWLEDFNPEVYLEVKKDYAKHSTSTVVKNWDGVTMKGYPGVD